MIGLTTGTSIIIIEYYNIVIVFCNEVKISVFDTFGYRFISVQQVPVGRTTVLCCQVFLSVLE